MPTNTFSNAKKPPPNSKAPDVHLILLDAVSTSIFSRSMQKTLNFLQNEMDAVVFSHVNKVALNSRPNGYAFLLGLFACVRVCTSHTSRASRSNDKQKIFSLGERGEFLPPNPWGVEDAFARGDELCHKTLEDENVIYFDYRARGYRTLVQGAQTCAAWRLRRHFCGTTLRRSGKMHHQSLQIYQSNK